MKTLNKVLITGSAGFIGSNLLENYGDSGVPFDLKNGQNILDYHQLDEVIRENEIQEIYHLAAQAFVGPGEKDPYLDVEINIKGTLNILEACRKHNLKLLYTSSGAVYGNTPVPQREDMQCLPGANYGISKLAAELYVRKYSLAYGLDARSIRFSSVYGPGRGPHGPVNAFIHRAIRGETLEIYGDGNQTRDLLYIIDAIDGLKTVMEHGDPGQTYNLGSGEEHSVIEVAMIVSAISNIPMMKVDIPILKTFDVQRSFYDINKAQALGFMPKTKLREGIEKTYMIESSEFITLSK